MEKLIFCNLDLLRKNFESSDYDEFDFTYYDESSIERIRNEFVDALVNLTQQDSNKVFFYSRNNKLLETAQKTFDDIQEFEFLNRSDVEDFVESHRDKNNYFVFVGGKNKDFFSAVNTHSLFIVPLWLPLEDKALLYGIRVQSVEQFTKFIKTLNNQNVWYSKIEIDDITTAYSLIDARYGYYARDDDEKEMVENFQKLLKEGMSINYHNILLYHFLAGMTNSMNFDDVELFGMIPSSNCTLNEYIFEFMEHVRLLKNKRLPRELYADDVPIEHKNLLIRHTEKEQNHNGGRNGSQRLSLGADDEFATLIINPIYKKKIDNLRKQHKFNVCIFDDYMTYGNSFNAVRNMLEKLGADKIIFVSVGLFKKPFQRRDYIIRGDVYTAGFDYEEENYQTLNNFEINEVAKGEVSYLREIFSA